MTNYYPFGTPYCDSISVIKTSKNYCNDPDFDGSSLATRHKSNNEHVITAYIYNIGTKEKRMYSTVSNVQNLLGVHEYMAHLKKGLKDSQHDIIFRMQKQHSSWKKTTKEFKDYETDLYSRK